MKCGKHMMVNEQYKYFYNYANSLLDRLENETPHLIDEDLRNDGVIDYIRSMTPKGVFNSQEDFELFCQSLDPSLFMFPVKKCHLDFWEQCKKTNKFFMPYERKDDHIIYETQNGKVNLYLPPDYLDDIVINDFFYLSHEESPHRYPIELIDDLYYSTNETINIIDCGSSEAIFEAIISTRYGDMNRFFFILIDPDKYWNEYACKTLDNIGVKYVIINKFLNYDFSLNDLCVSKIHVIKMDIEGAEVKACNEIKDICEKDHPIMMVCTYHNQNDYKEISELLTTYNYEYVYPSKHYMMYMNHDWMFPPYLVRGLCIAHN